MPRMVSINWTNQPRSESTLVGGTKLAIGIREQKIDPPAFGTPRGCCVARNRQPVGEANRPQMSRSSDDSKRVHLASLAAPLMQARLISRHRSGLPVRITIIAASLNAPVCTTVPFERKGTQLSSLDYSDTCAAPWRPLF